MLHSVKWILGLSMFNAILFFALYNSREYILMESFELQIVSSIWCFGISMVVLSLSHALFDSLREATAMRFVFVNWLALYILVLLLTLRGYGFGIAAFAFSLPLSSIAVPLALADWFILKRIRG